MSSLIASKRDAYIFAGEPCIEKPPTVAEDASKEGENKPAPRFSMPLLMCVRIKFALGRI
jgi:hypothetical protein